MNNSLEIYNQVALAMAYCMGATEENAREIAKGIRMVDVEKSVNAIKSVIANSTKLI